MDRQSCDFLVKLGRDATFLLQYLNYFLIRKFFIAYYGNKLFFIACFIFLDPYTHSHSYMNIDRHTCNSILKHTTVCVSMYALYFLKKCLNTLISLCTKQYFCNKVEFVKFNILYSFTTHAFTVM